MSSQDPERLSPEDARILRLEDAAITGHTQKIVILEPTGDAPLDVDELREHVAARLEREPRMRQRVAFTPLGLAPPAWVDCAEFDPREHVVAWHPNGTVGAEREPIDRAELLRIASRIMSTRLEHDRPLWRFDVIGPLEDGGSAVVVRIHHCMADGITCLRMLGETLWDIDPSPEPPEPAPWTPEPEPSSVDLLATGIRERAGAAVGAAAGAGRSLLDPRQWVAGARGAVRAAPALARELRPGGSSAALDRHIGSRRELAFVRAPLDELKRIEHAVGERLARRVTVNDVLLAGIAGGLREWLSPDREAELPALRAQCPVSMHHRDEGSDELGNRDSFLNVELPLSEPDPMRRLETISAETTTAKEHGDADALYRFFHGLSHVRPLFRAASRLADDPHEFSLAVSNVPGPREPINVMGNPVSELYSIAEPADRHALRISAVSCAGIVHVGLCTDPEALGGVADLASAVQASFAELAPAPSGR